MPRKDSQAWHGKIAGMVVVRKYYQNKQKSMLNKINTELKYIICCGKTKDNFAITK